MAAAVYIVLIAGWIAWLIPFFGRKPGGGASPNTLDKCARWGVLLQSVAYWLLWSNPFWTRRQATWQIVLAAGVVALACALSWTAIRILGRQWRIDAGLNPDHELVRAGPYRLVRHPIYCSMLLMLIGNGILVTPPLLLGVAIVIFLFGTEIRVRVEDALLTARFGDIR